MNTPKLLECSRQTCGLATPYSSSQKFWNSDIYCHMMFIIFHITSGPSIFSPPSWAQLRLNSRLDCGFSPGSRMAKRCPIPGMAIALADSAAWFDVPWWMVLSYNPNLQTHPIYTYIVIYVDTLHYIALHYITCIHAYMHAYMHPSIHYITLHHITSHHIT
jgi:hypothetical protein